MNRKIIPIKYEVKDPIPETDPIAAIHEQANKGLQKYLLAFSDDGVTWGCIEDSDLVLSSDYFLNISPTLREKTLKEVRLFGHVSEWFLWCGEKGWHSREIVDGEGDDGEAFTESIILWGRNVSKREGKGGFFLAEEADLGIKHAPPKELKNRHSLRLKVRHYLDFDEEGAVFVKLSRLVDLFNEGDEK